MGYSTWRSSPPPLCRVCACQQVRGEWAALGGVAAEPGRCVESGMSPNALSRMSLSRTLSMCRLRGSQSDCRVGAFDAHGSSKVERDPSSNSRAPNRHGAAAVCGMWCMIHTNAVSQESFSRRSSPFPPSSSVSLAPCFFATHPRAYHFPLLSRATHPSPHSRQ